MAVCQGQLKYTTASEAIALMVSVLLTLAAFLVDPLVPRRRGALVSSPQDHNILAREQNIILRSDRTALDAPSDLVNRHENGLGVSVL
eukprot:1865364-Amphidinium_carterae.2